MGEEAKKFIYKIGKLLQIKTGEKQFTSFILQQLSIEIQGGNGVPTFEADERNSV